MSRGGYRWGKPHVSVETCHSLSAWGRFQWVQFNGEDNLELKYREEDGWLVLDYKRDGGEYTKRIRLTETSCHFGGSRYWFVCPDCGRWVGKIYLPTTLYCRDERVQRWRCRHCYRLTYEQRRSKDLYWVLEWRAKRLLNRSGITTTKRGYWGNYRKPKGMRWKTFERFTDKINSLYKQANAHAYYKIWSHLKRYSKRPLTR